MSIQLYGQYQSDYNSSLDFSDKLFNVGYEITWHGHNENYDVPLYYDIKYRINGGTWIFLDSISNSGDESYSRIVSNDGTGDYNFPEGLNIGDTIQYKYQPMPMPDYWGEYESNILTRMAMPEAPPDPGGGGGEDPGNPDSGPSAPTNIFLDTDADGEKNLYITEEYGIISFGELYWTAPENYSWGYYTIEYTLNPDDEVPLYKPLFSNYLESPILLGTDPGFDYNKEAIRFRICACDSPESASVNGDWGYSDIIRYQEPTSSSNIRIYTEAKGWTPGTLYIYNNELGWKIGTPKIKGGNY